MMTIEYARNVLGLAGANSSELDPTTPHPVIDLMDTQRDVTDLGGTMRLGAYVAQLAEGSQVAAAYGTTVVSERHRHRYEFNPRYRTRFEASDLWCSGTSPGRPAGRVHRAATATRSGSAPRPTPSSRAGPPARRRCSASSSAPRWRRAEGRSPHLFELDAAAATGPLSA